jgi:competence protein ComEA
MGFREFLKKYFQFSKKERNGLIIFTFLMLLIVVVGYRIKHQEEKTSIEITSLETEATESLLPPKVNTQNKGKKRSRFAFDPNDISAEQAISLGFSKKTAAVLINFRNKGGKFKLKEDLKKVYGVSTELYSELEPYIIIKSALYHHENTTNNNSRLLLSDIKKINLNAADSAQLVELKGIGPILGKRILRYRNSLGGFHSVNQLAEVFGVSDTLLLQLKTKIEIDTSAVKRININTASLDEIKQHPYFKFIIAQSIVNYRKQHGPFRNEEQLKQIGSISDALLQKIKPYISY